MFVAASTQASTTNRNHSCSLSCGKMREVAVTGASDAAGGAGGADRLAMVGSRTGGAREDTGPSGEKEAKRLPRRPRVIRQVRPQPLLHVLALHPAPLRVLRNLIPIDVPDVEIRRRRM